MKFLILLLAFPIYTLQAQDTNSLEPNSSISTESADTVIIKTPTKQQAETPSISIYVKPQPPYISPDSFSPEFVANLIAGQLKNAVRLGLIPPNVRLKRLVSKRSAQEDLEFYSLSIMAHQRAIKEGKDVNFYIDEIKAGRYSIERLKRDVEVCGTGFEFWPNSRMCNQYATHEICEQQKDAADLTVKILNDKYQASVSTIEQLKVLVAKLSKKKGKK